MTRTHTYALLEISTPAFNEIAQKLMKAGYQQAFQGNTEIDMHGIGLAPDSNAKPDPRSRMVFAQDVVDLLNDASTKDAKAVRALIAARVECNAALGEHPTIQTGKIGGRRLSRSTGVGGYEVGLLGILNGIFGTFDNGWGCITAICDEHAPDTPIRFEVCDNSGKS
ncbi:MAG TPA: hypothetical protein VGV60_14970 [Candidatus Polarisedimenticolia bacterium]|jgi:hypothetical protein|nr:hypothetical protein [Candidatus Polarisedimenticolia bacterium]